MILSEDHIEQFENYVNGKMSDQEHDAFEELLRTNDHIREEFYIFSDIFEDLNIIADHELKNELNIIHEDFKTDHKTKENRIRKIYYGLGFLFFILILFTVYFLGTHQAEPHPKKHKETPVNKTINSIDSIEKINLQPDKPFKNKEAPSISVKPNVVIQELKIEIEYVPKKSYSFSNEGLKLYGINKPVSSINIIKDKNRYYLKLNNKLYLLEKTGDEVSNLETTKVSQKSLIENKNGIKIPVEYIPTLDSIQSKNTIITFKENFDHLQASVETDGIILSKSLHPLESIKELKDKSLLISTKEETFIYKPSSTKLEAWTPSVKQSTEYITLMDSFLENEYFQENNF